MNSNSDSDLPYIVPSTLQTLYTSNTSTTSNNKTNQSVFPKNNSIVIGGTVKNCATYLDAVFKNIQTIISCFSDYNIIIICDPGTDHSLDILHRWQTVLNHIQIIIQSPTSPVRTENLAHARNRILHEMRNIATTKSFPYFIMMDMDDVCARPIQLEILQQVFEKESEWESMTFPGLNAYYDIWALSCTPFLISCFHFEKSALLRMKSFILAKLAEEKWIPCYSSFGGFAIYKTYPYLFCHYDNSHLQNLKFLTSELISNNEQASESKLLMHNKEDCEHRFFHFTAAFKYGARMFIYPYTLFGYIEPTHVLYLLSTSKKKIPFI